MKKKTNPQPNSLPRQSALYDVLEETWRALNAGIRCEINAHIR